MNSGESYQLPVPVVDTREESRAVEIARRYEKMVKPGLAGKAISKAAAVVPPFVKDATSKLGDGFSEQQIYQSAMKMASQGFLVIEQQAARFSVRPEAVVKSVDESVSGNTIRCLDEICLARVYEIDRAVSKFKTRQIGLAAAEGASTGAVGLPGMAINLATSTLIFYRAVQSVAMYYGYDVKNDPAELELAGEVFCQAMSPGKVTGEVGSLIVKIVSIGEAQTVKFAAKKGWANMASRGGAALLITQLRALAHRAAANALKKTGQKELENVLFRNVLEQVGRRLALKTVRMAVPVVSGGLCLLFDTAQMSQIVDFAVLFYQKRFLLEKEDRVTALLEK